MANPKPKEDPKPSHHNEETYYDVLKLERNATISQIVAAYHTAKNAFSSDSVATYSLFTREENDSILAKLEEAYQTLSNLEKKREYDHFLELRDENADLPASMSELELKQRAVIHGKPVKKEEQKEAEIAFTPLVRNYEGYVNGSVLKEIREVRGLTVNEVAKTTKIPSRYIHAVEANNVEALPARVYLQGFVKNLAAQYHLDTQLVMKSYLDYVDHQDEPSEDIG